MNHLSVKTTGRNNTGLVDLLMYSILYFWYSGTLFFLLYFFRFSPQSVNLTANSFAQPCRIHHISKILLNCGNFSLVFVRDCQISPSYIFLLFYLISLIKQLNLNKKQLGKVQLQCANLQQFKGNSPYLFNEIYPLKGVSKKCPTEN